MCRYHASNCRPYVGRMVQIQTRNGFHRGMVDRVSNKGIYLRPVGLASGEKESSFQTLDSGTSALQADHVFYGGGFGYRYNPAVFLVPFLSILALSSLLFW
ncbi:hypothetical protein CIG75_12185 [Tumebacillus algifaecis]|uniref:Uncharacterized protein n=1 Tax=Tumebacillus algifaecis TaxID=1214604 RepID=A0A223D2K6_9BACL|nr:hypothetical protein CIG75_12185 [Tumebacillus algifaecis]